MNGQVALSTLAAYSIAVRSFAATLLLLAGLAAPVRAEPRVVLLTMGPGEALYTRFGHAALLVEQTPGPRGGTVYNYGYTDFRDSDLFWSFLRGRARFWVAETSYRATVSDYALQDRTLYRQPLSLTPAQSTELARLLAWGAREENRYYLYHHFHDNCSTRLRDLLDRVGGGAFARELKGAPGPGATLRDLVRQGFAGRLDLLLVTDLFLGRSGDRRLDAWDAAFLPRELRRSARETGLAPAARVVLRRQEPSPFAGHDPRAGVKLFWSLAGLGLLLALVLVLWPRRRVAGAALAPLALLCGLPGLAVWSVAAIATLPELRVNEIALSLWPTDLALLWPAGRWLRGRAWAGRLLRGYLGLRLAALGLVLVGNIAGLLIQRPLSWLALGVALILGAHLAVRQMPRNPGPPVGSILPGGGHGDQATDSAGPLQGV